MKKIEVTCAIIVKNDTFLACQRGPGSEHPYEWEFPGGKVELSETPEECIVREIWEELKVDIEIIKKLEPIDFDYPRMSIRLIPFLCSITQGHPTPVEHHTIRWQRINQFSELIWSEADRQLFALNEAHIV
ncbi:MAG TPA: (deoxy)nucleoside triphosphate pyrophosphohydrolase [Prolixibacteraceae bacterium]|nr:(deoxy)nucleoside triphosphate pyrophosphohydrolase [Prolixibacteraceae bacterium]HPS13994.1 (deoxy)nucleoside triphosphate pyrophosphohydrolase [Prolixibacteraceae bacterium]